MFLQRLTEYAHRLDPLPPMYLKMPIRWLLDIDHSGHLRGWVSLGEAKADRGKRVLAPHALRTVKIQAKLLADNAEYALGIPRSMDKRGRGKVARRHTAFIQEVAQCARATKEPAVKAVLKFLQQTTPEQMKLPADFTPSHNITFRVGKTLPIDLQTVRDYWAAVMSKPSERALTADALECIVCGDRRPVLRRQPVKIKHIPGGQASGMALISANAKAFESYGLEKSLIAPTCQVCAERYATAANALIEGEQTHLTIGSVVYLCWSQRASTFSPVSLLTAPAPEDVRALSFSTRKDRLRMPDPGNFYAAALSASGGRVVVRDWLETTVGQAQTCLARYFALQRVVGYDGTEAKPLKLYAVARSLSPDTAQDIAPHIPVALLRLAFHGGALPERLLQLAVTRNRVEQRVTCPRAAVIKMVLCSGPCHGQEDSMSALNVQNTSAAYRCGRLLAAMEAVQRAAIPNVNTTLAARFYGTASSAPGPIFGQLMRGTQVHLDRVRRERRATYVVLQARLEEIQGGIPAYPKLLTLSEQGLFALGYYHQRAADRATAIARGEAKRVTAENGTE